MFGLTRLRIVEVGIALLLTLAALLFVGLTVWAKDVTPIETRESTLSAARLFWSFPFWLASLMPAPSPDRPVNTPTV